MGDNEDRDRLADTPAYRETPHGVLYQPKPFAVQILLLLGAFAGGPAAGWLMARALGGVSSTGELLLYAAPTLIFFLGYGLWSARLAAIVFDALTRRVLRMLFDLFIKRRRPHTLEEVLPSKEKLEEMTVRAQRAAWSFLAAALPIGAGAALAALFMESDRSFPLRCSIVGGGCMLWGAALGALARRGYLPFPEGE